MPAGNYIYFKNPVYNQFSATVPITAPFMMKSLFSDNSLVVYKRGALSYGNVKTVSNSRAVARRT
jgi:hypothetical protein